MLITPGNFWQSNQSSNGHGESLDGDYKDPALLYPVCASPIYSPPDFNQFFSYNISEVCTREFAWSTANTTNEITLAAPSALNVTFANISVRIMNATLNESTIVDVSGNDEQRLAQVQGFIICSDSYFLGFSIYVDTTKSTLPVTFGIRNETYNAKDFYTIGVNLATGPNWQNITLPAPLFLSAGHYYIYMPSVGSQYNAWLHTDSAVYGDAWVNTVGNTWVKQDWDLTLKIQTRLAANITAVEMTIESQPVEDLGNGIGWANVSKIYTGNPMSFGVTNKTHIAFSYAANVTYFGNNAANISISLDETLPRWNLTFPLSCSSFSNYRANVTGLRDDYENLQVSAGGSVGGYTWLNSTTINFTNPVDLVTFQSPNYIKNLTYPTEVYSGNPVEIQVGVVAYGNVSVGIFNGSTPIFQDHNDSMTSDETSFVWTTPVNAFPGTLSLQAFYLGDNEIGVNMTTFMLKNEAVLSTGGINTPALTSALLYCRYYDASSLDPIPGAQVGFNMSGVSGQMSYQDSGNFTTFLNLEQIALLPGIYSLTFTAASDGYRPRSVTTQMQINYRQVHLHLTQNIDILSPGEAVRFDLSLEDEITDSLLSRPINLTLAIYASSGNPNQPIESYKFIGITTTGQYSWFVPANIGLGQYDINVTVESPYFAGTIVVPQAVNIVPAPNTMVIILIVIGIIVLGIGSYIQRMRILSKRSVRGAIIMNPGGLPIARRIANDFSTMNPHLIAGAVMGIVTMVKEMTGSSIRTIALEGRYLKIFIKESFWLVLLTQKNPSWIFSLIKKMAMDIEENYGPALKEWTGEGVLNIPIDVLLKHYFGVEIKEVRDPEFYESVGNQETTDQNPQPSPSSGDATVKKE